MAGAVEILGVVLNGGALAVGGAIYGRLTQRLAHVEGAVKESKAWRREHDKFHRDRPDRCDDCPMHTSPGGVRPCGT